MDQFQYTKQHCQLSGATLWSGDGDQLEFHFFQAEFCGSEVELILKTYWNCHCLQFCLFGSCRLIESETFEVVIWHKSGREIMFHICLLIRDQYEGFVFELRRLAGLVPSTGLPLLSASAAVPLQLLQSQVPLQWQDAQALASTTFLFWMCKLSLSMVFCSWMSACLFGISGFGSLQVGVVATTISSFSGWITVFGCSEICLKIY